MEIIGSRSSFNLPHTSMRDLAIHGDDLIVGTHGRSFWILDDITPLRQMSADIAKAAVTLYQPEEAIRFRWNRNTDTPLPPDTPAGKNPPDGAILDYYLAEVSGKPVTLEIFDHEDHLVRRYSSTDKPEPLDKIAAENPIPMYWVRPQQMLSAERGCIVSSGTCTIRRPSRSIANSPFRRLRTTLRRFRLAHGLCRENTSSS